MVTQKAVDLVKDMATYGAAFFAVAYGLFEVAQLATVKVIDGATAMTFFSNIASAAAGFLFGVALTRSQTRAVLQGVATPTSGTTVQQADTVQTGGPTTVTNP